MAQKKHHVVIVGGGFGGLHVARAFKSKNIQITLVDRKNHHLFQPLLYQVATGGLSQADIASPIRGILKKRQHIRVLLGEVIDILPRQKKIILKDCDIDYDTLVVATGVQHHYFGNESWEEHAPSLKSVEDAIYIRKKILQAFEIAELEQSVSQRQQFLNFIIVGGGSTGVEMAGAIGELAKKTLKGNFRSFDPTETQIELVEALPRILPEFDPELSKYAAKKLAQLGVHVRTDSKVTDVTENGITIQKNDQSEFIAAKTIFWAAGTRASALGYVLQQRLEAETDKSGRLVVNQHCQLPQKSDIFVIGDLALAKDKHGKPIPGVAQAAIQQGKYVAKYIDRKLKGEDTKPYRYKDKGDLVVIGRGAAISRIWKFKDTGLFAWVLWLLVHIIYLVGFQNRMMVLVQWAWFYITKNKGARLITRFERPPSHSNANSD